MTTFIVTVTPTEGEPKDMLVIPLDGRDYAKVTGLLSELVVIMRELGYAAGWKANESKDAASSSTNE